MSAADTMKRQHHDPAWILQTLSDETHRDQFVREYQAAAAAATDPSRYGDLQDLVRRWALLAMAVSAPDYNRRTTEVREMIATGQRGVPMEKLIRERQAAREQTR